MLFILLTILIVWFISTKVLYNPYHKKEIQMKIYVNYENDLYEVIGEHTRETYLIDRRDSCPNYMLTLRLVRNPRITRKVKIKYVKFQFEW